MNQNSLWYKNAVFYQVYVRAFFDSTGDGLGDLPGLAQKLDYLQQLGVDCIWLMPVYPSPLNDDGYDISDYYGILQEYGSLDDFKFLVEAIHKRGMRVITIGYLKGSGKEARSTFNDFSTLWNVCQMMNDLQD